MNTLQNELLGICKYCKKFLDTGKKQNRYRCFSQNCSIFEAHNCRKTSHIREKLKENNDEKH
jgi:hypothetical protein